MIEVLRPGGWLLIEEVDFFPVHTSSSKAYSDFMVALTNTVVKAPGCGCFWARALPELVAGMGLLQFGGEGDFSVLQGGSPIAEFFSLTADQMRERMLESGAQSAEQLDHALALLNDPNFWAFGGGGVAVWGQRDLTTAIPWETQHVQIPPMSSGCRRRVVRNRAPKGELQMAKAPARMSPFGPTRTSRRVHRLSEMRVKADVPHIASDFRW